MRLETTESGQSAYIGTPCACLLYVGCREGALIQENAAKKKIVSNLAPFTVRLPDELALELPSIAEYLMAKDPSELVRGWIRLHALQIMGSKAYQGWKKMKAAKGICGD